MLNLLKKSKLGLMIFLSAILLTYCSPSESYKLENNREKWKSQNISHYSFVIVWLAFGPREVAGKPVRIEVLNGKRVALECLDCELPETDFFDDLDTAEKLFDRVQSSIAAKPYSLSIIYDDDLGYPVSISGENHGPRVTDDSWSIRISQFKVIDGSGSESPDPPLPRVG
ncbi:MAG: DUF6174 domain-containing protein [Pyrinomonadaceae bacterium]